MTITDIRVQGYARDLATVQALLDTAGGIAASDGTAISALINVHCPTTEVVDSAAARWGVRAHWTKDRTQYVAQTGDWRIQLCAVYVLRPAAVAA